MLDKWVYERGIRIDFSRPGNPTDNATVESFNGRLREECLNENWFMSLEDARCKIEAWRIQDQIRGADQPINSPEKLNVTEIVRVAKAAQERMRPSQQDGKAFKAER